MDQWVSSGQIQMNELIDENFRNFRFYPTTPYPPRGGGSTPLQRHRFYGTLLGKPNADIDILNGQEFLLYEKFLTDISGIGQQVEVTFAKTSEGCEIVLVAFARRNSNVPLATRTVLGADEILARDTS